MTSMKISVYAIVLVAFFNTMLHAESHEQMQNSEIGSNYVMQNTADQPEEKTDQVRPSKKLAVAKIAYANLVAASVLLGSLALFGELPKKWEKYENLISCGSLLIISISVIKEIITNGWSGVSDLCK